jgi:hypothetical protein
MAELGDALAAAIGNNCLADLLLDTSVDPGLQPDCKVYDELGGDRTELPRCQAGGPRPCYDLVADPARCPFSPSHFSVTVDRPDPAPDGTEVVIECFTTT